MSALHSLGKPFTDDSTHQLPNLIIRERIQVFVFSLIFTHLYVLGSLETHAFPLRFTKSANTVCICCDFLFSSLS